MTRSQFIYRVGFAVAAIYMLASWAAFQWRNPTANGLSFFREFREVATWEKLPKYQP